MVNRNLLRQFDSQVDDSFLSEADDLFNQEIAEWVNREDQDYDANKIVTGKVLEIRGDDVVIDIGYKSEGVIKIDEWREDGSDAPPPKAGDTVEVLLETVEGEDGTIALSYRKAKRQKEWNAILAKHKEGDVVSGRVLKKIKGGLLVNIGVNVFLPASQVDIRRPQSIDEYLDRTIECVILKIDEQRRNIVVSRRKLIEDRRRLQKDKLMSELEVSQVRKGVVKNIAEFGAFVDLGGIDGLLHITDMGWHRVTNPRDVVQIDQELEVYILHIDREKEKIALSLKHKTPSPWQNIETKYPINSRHNGEVVNIMPYGAFVKLEPGIEGLVHISEMSWVKRIADPKELVQIGDKVEVQVLNINHDKKEISLGMKQCQANPWGEVAKKYPPGTIITGTVRNLTNYGAFIEIEEGIDGLLHVSDMSYVRKVSNPSEVVQKGQKLTCVVLSVDQERKRVALGLKQMGSDPWETDIPARFTPGQKTHGKVTKLTNFGVFVELEPGLEGLLHISELSDAKIESPEEVVKVGDDVDVKVLRVDAKDRKIGLSMKNVDDGLVPDIIPDMPTEEMEAAAAAERAEKADRPADKPEKTDKPFVKPEKEKKEGLRGGTGTAGPLFALPGDKKE
ncbi:30s ribosomal protein s1 : 30S ribosomal protein S1 OS=Isosphaera pallida (strain ATCC 43644 / DSM 9630 / IS1B) GN=Isop_1182 PE=3 SV=1: S1: S1: S1: S1: S1: S1 [Gemmataceae bacterium]|nr:30s ribosomal protein s1 : 30S ribosomal protein S1 OS=Isosphaera pallida (strain ATCC 43644 / DSM 9630 / IS1B) GN=Isop_1182 PE=3 SV=1: S1: S1: S1: S1: S1: S1 [Gemmataceae bacterium]VTU00753.1 30s ribosomal protein s1 : 30S ribosomal protein S1 OS=Isosphaera pallida (strain ATCC 43644 / DSM 9630 / IS1B) GN=Isop_1182 PE=3 SV=1: S1: S1: S1: S1: S1: S1 [Gemmataceae bacterium]